MPRVPDILLQKLMSMPENFVDEACKKLGITDTLQFHIYMDNPLAINKSSKHFLIKVLSSADTQIIEAIYKKIELGLLISGCVPYLGIVVNIVDACFCFALGNMFGCFIAIIACFPIPGFKAVGKGLDVVVSDLLRKISPSEIVLISKELIKKLQRFYRANCNHEDVKKGLMLIVQELQEISRGLRNPFIIEYSNLSRIIDNLSNFSNKLPNTISNNISHTYSVLGKQVHLLSLTERSVK